MSGWADETERLERALAHWVTLKGDLCVAGAKLDGTFGALMMVQLAHRFKDDGADPTIRQLYRWFESCYHHQKRVVSAVAVAHQAPVKVGGVLPTWERWGKMRRRLKLDTHLAAKAEFAIGIGSCGIRPTWSLKPGVLPGIAAVPPALFSAYGTETNPLDVVRVVQRFGSLSMDGNLYQTDYVILWDVSDPDHPRFEKWRSEEESKRRGGRPIMSFNDGRYPWREVDTLAPVLPWVIYQGQPDSSCILPLSGLAEDTWQLMVRLTWATFPEVIRGWDIPMPYGETKILGLERSVARPTAYVPFYGKGVKGVAFAPSAVPSVKGRMDIWREKVAIAADRYDRRLHVVDRKEAASGIALELEASQERAAFSDQESRWAPEDARALDHWRMTWNRWVDWGLLNEERIPEGEITVNYRYYQSPAARAHEIAEERQAMIDGPGSPVAYHMARRGLDWNDPTQRDVAREELDVLRQERDDYQDMLPRQQSPITIQGATP